MTVEITVRVNEGDRVREIRLSTDHNDDIGYEIGEALAKVAHSPTKNIADAVMVVFEVAGSMYCEGEGKRLEEAMFKAAEAFQSHCFSEDNAKAEDKP